MQNKPIVRLWVSLMRFVFIYIIKGIVEFLQFSQRIIVNPEQNILCETHVIAVYQDLT